MGMSTHVVGIKPPDEKWFAMKAVWDACEKAGVEVPDEVHHFFGDESPDPAGVVVEEEAMEKAGAFRKWQDDMCAGYEILVSRLPKDVAIVRVYNSW